MNEYSNKTIKKNSGILLGSVETHDCDPYMNCPECKGTGTCQECKGQGEVKCHTCHGNGQCTDCHGKGQWRCDACFGSGMCRKCHGTGDVECSYCRGTGKVWHKAVSGSGASDGWKDCPKCGGAGKTPCPDCRSGMQTAVKALDIVTFGAGRTYGHGTGKCSKCGGSGEIVCKTCNGTGNCPTCDGSGQLTCNHCNGSGNCPNCDNGKVTCERCNGSGYYQTFIRQTSTLYSKGWQWSGSTEYRDIIKASYGRKLHDGIVKKWQNANIVETDIVEETNQKCATALGEDKDLYKEFLSKYEEQTELSKPINSLDKPYAKELIAQRLPITKIKYTINDEEYEVAIIGDNNIVAAKSVPTVIKGFELSRWAKIKLAMTEKNRLKAYARLAAYIFQCDGRSVEESNLLNSMIKALIMKPQVEAKFRKELEGLNSRMPYEKVRKMIRPLLHSKKTITFAWQCMAVDKKVTQDEQLLFAKIVSEYKLEQSEIERLKGLAYKFSKLKNEQIAIEYANLSEEFTDIRKKAWRTIVTTILIIVSAIGITTYLLLSPESLSAIETSYDTESQFDEANLNEEISDLEGKIESEITDVDVSGNLEEQLNKIFDYVYGEEDGYYKVQKNSKYGLVDASTGKIVVQPVYKYIDSVEDGFIKVQRDGKYGLLNANTGQLVAQCIYSNIYSMEDGVVKVKQDNLYGFLNSEGKEIVSPKYKYVYSEEDGLIKVQGSNNKYGFLNSEYKEIVAPQYDYIYSLEDDVIKVQQNSLYGFLDSEGKEIVSPKYKYVYSEEDGLIKVQGSNNKYGFLNSEYKEIVAPQYDYIYSFEGGLAKVQKDGKYGYISEDGKLVKELQ